MIRKVAWAAGFLAAAWAAQAAKLTFPQTRAATEVEIKEYQSLGRVVTAPDGSFFLYEWSRPYNWAPDVKWLAPSAAQRMQTWIYRVDTTGSDTTSRYLIYPGSGCTYYLGELSPDAGRVSVYEVNHDDNSVRLGVVTFDDIVAPTITWFEPPPDTSKLQLAPVWVSNDELVYPAKTGLLKARVPAKVASEELPLNRIDKSVKAELCRDCKPRMLEAHAGQVARTEKARLAVFARKEKEIPKNAKVIARSERGDLDIYSVDTLKILTLGFARDATGKVLFENEREMVDEVSKK